MPTPELRVRIDAPTHPHLEARSMSATTVVFVAFQMQPGFIPGDTTDVQVVHAPQPASDLGNAVVSIQAMRVLLDATKLALERHSASELELPSQVANALHLETLELCGEVGAVADAVRRIYEPLCVLSSRADGDMQ